MQNDAGCLKGLERLEVIRKQNAKREWINCDLYRLMFKPDLYILAYERIKSKPGNMTPGTDQETIDGFGMDEIRKLIEEMRTEKYKRKWETTASSIFLVVNIPRSLPSGKTTSSPGFYVLYRLRTEALDGDILNRRRKRIKEQRQGSETR